MFDALISKYFSKLGVALSKSFTRYAAGAISACSFSTYEIARHVSKATKKDFNTAERGLNYLLCNDNFQIDDTYWRMHTNMIFDLMKEQNLIQNKEKIYIQIDFTSHENYFLILSASIIVNNRAVPLYFTMRNYPKKKDQYNHKKMEQAFLQGLKHVLSKRYQYVIVADRGFGNQRFLNLCEACGFEYLIRTNPNLKIEIGEKVGLMEEICESDGGYKVYIKSWTKEQEVYRCSQEEKIWYLMSNIKELSDKEAQNIYENRFKIEKCFQDLKSSGFDMEKSKIRKYSNYKKLLAVCMVAHSLLVMLGNLIVVKMPHFLKNSADMADVILAYFLLEERHKTYFLKNTSPNSSHA